MIAERNETVDFMKANVDRLIYSSVQIESIAATFAQTREIVEKGVSTGVSSKDTNKIVALKHAWQYLFRHFDESITWDLYSNYNALLGEGNVPNAGKMRGPGEVRVGDYIPPDNIDVGYFNRCVETASGTAFDDCEAACNLFLLLARAQFFRDGNKRSAQILANHYLASHDSLAAFIVDESTRDEVLDILVDFYEGRLLLNDASWDLEELCVDRAEKMQIAERRYGCASDFAVRISSGADTSNAKKL